MKNLFVAILTIASISVFAQPGKKGKEPSMTPEFVKGYYLNLKGDSVKGEVQSNMERESDYYLSFKFKVKGVGKGAEINTKKAKGYGFNDNHFTTLHMDQNDVYIKYLEQGRLNLMEWKYPGVGDDAGKIMSVYFVVDTRAAADDKNNLNVLTQLNEKSHKKILKPFFKDQPILLEQVDKWFFKIDEVRKAVQEFNALYTN
jgi:hypothetical protein